MPRNRTDFTENQRAGIYCRDQATCCFSGTNLWLLDGPLHYYTETDWTDHVRPASRGGRSDEKNGVCASHSFNIKKRNNSSDKEYLFKDGAPTPFYFQTHGCPPPELTDRLQRMANLQKQDWYFNRMIANIKIGLGYKWDPTDHKRKDKWLGEFAFNFKTKAEQAGVDPNFKKRGLLKKPTETQKLLISLLSCSSPESFTKQALQLYPEYKLLSGIWCKYFYPNYHEDTDDPKKCDKRRRKTYEEAAGLGKRLDARIFDCIHADYLIRFGHP